MVDGPTSGTTGAPDQSKAGAQTQRLSSVNPAAILRFTFWPIDADHEKAIKETTVDLVNGVASLSFSAKNIGSTQADNGQIWIQLCDGCRFAEEPADSTAPAGEPNVRRKQFLALHRGSYFEGTLLKIIPPTQVSQFTVAFKYACAECPPVNNKHPQKLMVNIRQELPVIQPPADSKQQPPSQDNSVHGGNGGTITQTSNGNCSPNMIGGSNTVNCGSSAPHQVVIKLDKVIDNVVDHDEDGSTVPSQYKYNKDVIISVDSVYTPVSIAIICDAPLAAVEGSIRTEAVTQINSLITVSSDPTTAIVYFEGSPATPEHPIVVRLRSNYQFSVLK